VALLRPGQVRERAVVALPEITSILLATEPVGVA
jgi:hypothetical protein